MSYVQLLRAFVACASVAVAICVLAPPALAAAAAHHYVGSWATSGCDSCDTSTTSPLTSRAGGKRRYDRPSEPRRGRTAATPDFVATKEVDEGFVYLRTDEFGSKPYVGQSKSAGRYKARQTEHARDNPLADFDYDILGRAEPGTALDRLEEFFIRGHGGPTTKRNPNGALANKRHQMSESRYEEAGGGFP